MQPTTPGPALGLDRLTLARCPASSAGAAEPLSPHATKIVARRLPGIKPHDARAYWYKIPRPTLPIIESSQAFVGRQRTNRTGTQCRCWKPKKPAVIAAPGLPLPL